MRDPLIFTDHYLAKNISSTFERTSQQDSTQLCLWVPIITLSTQKNEKCWVGSCSWVGFPSTARQPDGPSDCSRLYNKIHTLQQYPKGFDDYNKSTDREKFVTVKPFHLCGNSTRLPCFQRNTSFASDTSLFCRKASNDNSKKREYQALSYSVSSI